MDLSIHPDAEESVKKEICVHKLLKHRNVVGCYGSRCVTCVIVSVAVFVAVALYAIFVVVVVTTIVADVWK